MASARTIITTVQLALRIRLRGIIRVIRRVRQRAVMRVRACDRGRRARGSSSSGAARRRTRTRAWTGWLCSYRTRVWMRAPS